VGLRLDGYVRVSRVGGREGEGYISPDVQRDAIAAYAAELSGEIVAWHDDQDFSGGNIERPGFQAVIERLRAGETDGVVVMRVDRFARSVADGAAVVREIVDRGQVFASCHERIDPRTPEGRFMLTSFLANAELFLDQAKAGWWAAKSRAIARGVHIGPTPIGYRRERSQPLVPDPIFGPAMTDLFARGATREYGDTALAHWFNERAPHPNGRRWQAPEVRRWLSNRIYLGEIRYGELANPEAHEPLTDPETWARCQREPRAQRRPHSSFLLTGLVRCAACRYAMGGQTYGGAKQDTPIYRCSGRAGCPEPSVIVAARLDQFVIQEIHRWLEGITLRGAKGVDLDLIDREAREADGELQAFAADLTARRLLGEAGWQAGLQARVADRDAKATRRSQALAESDVEALAHRAADLGDHDLGDLLGAVRHVFIRRRRGVPASERTLIIWADDPIAIDLPGPHRVGPFEAIRW